jgi:hypothetical protein
MSMVPGSWFLIKRVRSLIIVEHHPLIGRETKYNTTEMNFLALPTDHMNLEALGLLLRDS